MPFQQYFRTILLAVVDSGSSHTWSFSLSGFVAGGGVKSSGARRHVEWGR